MQSCYLCQSELLIDRIDFGLQPVSNRFLKKADEKEDLFPLKICQCSNCGLVQIAIPIPAKELRPAYDWITYNEPEPHLDSLAETIAGLPGLTPQSGIWGVSFKDDSLLRRLEKLGFANTYRLDMANDLKIQGKGAGVETVQEMIEPGVLEKLTNEKGKPQVVIARHIIEHAHDFNKFIKALYAMVQPGGYLVLEAPDCQRALESYDYTTIWEEHTLYFTPVTFKNIFHYYHLDNVYFQIFPYAFENSIVGIGKLGDDTTGHALSTNEIQIELDRMAGFSDALNNHRGKLSHFLANFQKSKGSVALFGAGHLACAFINYLGVKDKISFVADDNPHKQGLYIPGSGIPIRPSKTLVEENIKLALFSLSPEVEDKVVEKNELFLENGGQFGSIFPASKRAIKLDES